MTSLLKRMTEDMQVRNLDLNTQTSYVQQVSLFAHYFDKSPELLGPDDIRAYRASQSRLHPIRSATPLRFIFWKRERTSAPFSCCWATARSLSTIARYLRLSASKVCSTSSPLDLLPRPIAVEPEPSAPQHF